MKTKRRADHTILGIHITDRVRHASEVQQALTAHGCQIKTRLGLHEVSDDYCAPSGIILLEVVGSASDRAALVRDLRRIEGVEVRKMVFTH